MLWPARVSLNRLIRPSTAQNMSSSIRIRLDYSTLSPTNSVPHTMYRIGYPAINACAVVLVSNIPGSFLWDEGAGETLDGQAFAVFLSAILVANVAFFALQGSDPGYLYSDRDPEGGVNSIFGGDEGLHRSAPGPEIKGRDIPDQRGGGALIEEEKAFQGGLPRGGGAGVGTRAAVAVGETESKDLEADTTRLLGETASEVTPREDQFSVGERISSLRGRGGLGDDMTARPADKVLINALVRENYVLCGRCGNIEVPLRSHHCRECGRCVATFDHHCKVLGTCIGERNHCRFWWFLLAQTLSLAVALRITTSGFSGHASTNSSGVSNAEDTGAFSGEGTHVGETSSAGRWATDHSLALLASICLWPCLFMAVIMLLTHTWMAVSASTSFECLKGADSLPYLQGTREFDLPFSDGILGNLRGFCCGRDAACWWPQSFGGPAWRPRIWNRPGIIVRDSEDWRSNLWENKYWSCC